MRLTARIGRLARRFLRDGTGNIAMMAGFILPVLVLAAGFAVNVGQISITRTNLLAALDAAVTSTARDLTTGVISEEDAPKVVEAFLITNGLRAFAEEGKLTLDSIVIDRLAGTVSARASVELDVAFGLFGAANRQKISAESAALYSDKRIEVAMMLDVTDSMSGSKIRDLKNAAIAAVEALTRNQNATNPRIRIALVPYSNGVNVGTLAKDVVFVEKAGGWDLPPPIGASAVEIAANTGVRTNNCATERKDENFMPDYSDDAPDSVRKWPYDPKKEKEYYAKVNRDDRLSTCAKAVMTPLTADTVALKKQIDDFSVAGYTGGGTGVQWTYYMLSPKWRATIQRAGLGDGPADHDSKEVAKVAILMTDGEFNTVHADVVGDNWTVRRQGPKARANAEAICGRMKADGIEIFTIGFKLPNAAARNVMKNCASPDSGTLQHYYETSSGAELNEAFMTIARNIEALVLTQ